jgi:hypothetical protein
VVVPPVGSRSGVMHLELEKKSYTSQEGSYSGKDEGQEGIVSECRGASFPDPFSELIQNHRYLVIWAFEGEGRCRCSMTDTVHLLVHSLSLYCTLCRVVLRGEILRGITCMIFYRLEASNQLQVHGSMSGQRKFSLIKNALTQVGTEVLCWT